MAKTILLVDDSATALFREQVILRQTGHAVVTARNGEEAVARALAEKPDLILLDVVMPGMDGFEACKRLRQLDETRLTPIIMVTNRGDEESMEVGYQSGCNDYVLKPVDDLELLAKIRDHLGK